MGISPPQYRMRPSRPKHWQTGFRQKQLLTASPCVPSKRHGVGRFLMDLYGKLRNRIVPKSGPGLAELMDQLLLADAEQLGQ